MKERIYDQYIQAYRKGVFDLIKEDYDRLSETMIPRKYFSGGFKGDVTIDRAMKSNRIRKFTGRGFVLSTMLTVAGAVNQPLLAQETVVSEPAAVVGGVEEDTKNRR